MQRLSFLLTAITILALKAPRITLSVMILLVILLCIQLKHLSFDTSGESFLKADDPARLAYLDFENRYGLSAYFIIFIEDLQIFSADKIAAIENIEKVIFTKVPNVVSVESIVSATAVSSDDDSIVVSRLFPEDRTHVDYVAKKNQAISMPYYLNRLVNQKGDATAIIVRLNQYVTNASGRKTRLNVSDVQETLAAIKIELDAFKSSFSHPILVGGTPAVTAELTAATKNEMLMFTLVSLIIVVTTLFIIFRNIFCALLPLLSLLFTVLLVLSLMAIFKTPVHITGSIIPSFLLAICVGDAVHFIKFYLQNIASSFTPYEASIKAIQHSSVAMFFTSLTTFLGLISFSLSHVEPVSSFGLYSAMGVWFALFFTLTILPCLFVIFAVSPDPASNRVKEKSHYSSVKSYLSFINRCSKSIVCASVILLVTGLYFASQLTFTYNPMSWFHDHNPVKQASIKIEQKLSGIMQVELLIRQTHGKETPLSLIDMKDIDKWLDEVKQFGINRIPIQAESSIFQFLKEMHHAMDNAAGYTMPTTQEEMAQEMLLLRFDANEVVNSLINEEGSEIRITLSIPWQDSLVYNSFVKDLKHSFRQRFGENLDVEITGMATVGNKAFGDLIHSMSLSYLQALVMVMISLAVLFHNAKLSALMLLPNILPIVLVLALMKIMSIPLDLFTLLIGCVALGLVVDDTIHFVQGFQHYLIEYGNVEDALIHTIQTTGGAMIITTIVLSGGFLVYCLSSLNNLVAFGFLTAITVFFALLADLLLAPAILILFYRNKPKAG